MENAPRVLSSRAYETARVVLNEGGYSTVAAVLRATDHGVAQTRRRAFVFGARDPAVAHRVAAALRAARRLIGNLTSCKKSSGGRGVPTLRVVGRIAVTPDWQLWQGGRASRGMGRTMG